jgi:hypothetical protein
LTVQQTYDIAVKRPGGYGSLQEAMAHRKVVGKLMEKIDQSSQVAEQLRTADVAEVSSSEPELNRDLAAGKGHVIMISEDEGQPLYGAELSYNVNDGTTRSLTIELPDSKLNQLGTSFKLEENGVTTYFRHDAARGVLSVMDGKADVPQIFNGADPNKLTAGTIQSGQGFLVF